MITLEILTARRAEILALGERWGAHNIRVFGSVARGETGPWSDLDLLVDFEPERSLLDHGGFLSDMQDLLGVRVDLVTERALRPRFRERILRDARAI